MFCYGKVTWRGGLIWYKFLSRWITSMTIITYQNYWWLERGNIAYILVTAYTSAFDAHWYFTSSGIIHMICICCGGGGFAWWHHQMEIFSALLVLCAGNSPVTGEFPSQRPATRSFDVFFDLRLNKRLSTQSKCRWFESHRAHYDVTVMYLLCFPYLPDLYRWQWDTVAQVSLASINHEDILLLV